MSDTDTGSDSDSDSSDVRVDLDDASISPTVREQCNRLRTDDPRRVSQEGPNDVLNISSGRSEAERIGIAQALEENTTITDIAVQLLHDTKISTKAFAKYVKASKHLQSVYLRGSLRTQMHHGVVSVAATEYPAFSVLLRALSHSTSVKELNLDNLDVRFASVAFQKLLTRTQTLQSLQLSSTWQLGDYVQQAAVASAFANNTTLCELELTRQAGLAPVFTALQDHPTL
jgi:hypothetical protein